MVVHFRRSKEDRTIIEKLMKFKQEETKDWWDTISKEEQESIEKGISDADNGKLKPHANAKKLYEKWL